MTISTKGGYEPTHHIAYLNKRKSFELVQKWVNADGDEIWRELPVLAPGVKVVGQ